MLCCRLFEFDSAHRVLEHTSKCQHLHGHRYKAEVYIHADEMNKLGMVMDFGDIKKSIGDWIDTNWDHNIILNRKDSVLSHVLAFEKRKPFVMPEGKNPTAEHMAEVLLEAADTIVKQNHPRCRVTKVRLYETPNCFAEYENPFFHV